MGCAAPVLLHSSIWQLGSRNTLHIHVKLCLMMRLQSPDTLLQTQSIVVRRWPSVYCRSVDIFTVSLLSCVLLLCFLQSKAFRGQEILGFVAVQRWLVMKMKQNITSAQLRRQELF